MNGNITEYDIREEKFTMIETENILPMNYEPDATNMIVVGKALGGGSNGILSIHEIFVNDDIENGTILAPNKENNWDVDPNCTDETQVIDSYYEWYCTENHSSLPMKIKWQKLYQYNIDIASSKWQMKQHELHCTVDYRLCAIHMQLIYTIYLFYSKSERMLIQKRNPIFTIIHTTFILLIVGFQSQFYVLYFSQFNEQLSSVIYNMVSFYYPILLHSITWGFALIF